MIILNNPPPKEAHFMPITWLQVIPQVVYTNNNYDVDLSSWLMGLYWIVL